MKNRKAFSLTEMLISMIIVSILGAGIVTALWFFLASHHQTDDYTTMDMEIERAIQRLTREFALAGLGMPNNRRAYGSFALSFTDTDGLPADRPAMASFGQPGSAWGGPVTVSAASTGAPVMPTVIGDMYIGPELYYAWAVPVRTAGKKPGAKARVWKRGAVGGEKPPSKIINDTTLTLEFENDGVVQTLMNQRWDGRDIGLIPEAANGASTRRWLVMPMLGLPMRVDRRDGNALDVTVAPVRPADLDPPLDPPITLEIDLPPLDDAHLVQAARIFLRNDGTIVRSFFDDDYEDEALTLGVNVARLCFAYDKKERLLSMFIAVRGAAQPLPGVTAGVKYPPWLPASEYLTDAEREFRVAAKTLSWRIRN